LLKFWAHQGGFDEPSTALAALVQRYGSASHRQLLALLRDADAADAKRMPLSGLQALSSPGRAEYYS
jgi:hypothetical protein